MEAKMLGIDLTDNEAGIALSDSDCCFHIPTAICRDKKHDLWYIGETAYEKALAGKGIITDKLLALTEKHGTATIRGVRYEALDLLCRFLFMLRELCVERSGGSVTDGTVLVLPDYDRAQTEAILTGMEAYGFSREKTFCVSRAESFLYYVMSQPREVRTGEVGLFDLSDQSLVFYELTTKRERKKIYVHAEKEDLEEAFTLSVLKSPAGEKLADKIMSSAAERLLRNKNFSGILLTGRGFERYDWAREFMRQICSMRRRVFLDSDIFAKGALVRGTGLLNGRGDPGFVAVCSGRVGASVTMNVEKNGQSMVFPLISTGDPVSLAGVELRLLPDGEREIELRIDAFHARKERSVKIPLSFLPERERKTCFVDFSAQFRDEKTMCVTLRDAGFGELFPRTDAAVEEVVQLWE